MSSISASTVPSARALRQLNNRNNVADLHLHKYLQQVERQKDYYISDLDKDRLDVADFLKDLIKCDSDDLPQNKIVKQDTDSEGDNDDFHIRSHRNTHTAKTEPSRSRRRRRRRPRQDHQNDDYDDDNLSLDDVHGSRPANAGANTRRQMLSQRRKEEKLALESAYDKAEDFLAKLRLDLAQEQTENSQTALNRKQFTAYLLMKIQGEDHLDGKEEEEEEQVDGTWAKARVDMVYPIKRLGDIATKFKLDPGHDGSPAGEENTATRVRLRSSSLRKKAASGERGSELLPELLPLSGSRSGSNRRRAISSQQKMPRQRSVFDITDDDPPPSALPRVACMPDPNRVGRDLIADTARAFGFGEAAVVTIRGQAGRVSPPPQESSPTPGPSAAPRYNSLTRASMAERRRLERQAKMKVTVPVRSKSRHADAQKGGDQGSDAIRALLHFQSMGPRSRPLNERVKEFLHDLDTMDKGPQLHSDSE